MPRTLTPRDLHDALTPHTGDRVTDGTRRGALLAASEVNPHGVTVLWDGTTAPVPADRRDLVVSYE